MRNAAIGVVVVIAVLAAGIAVARGVSPSAAKAIPTAHVQQGRVQVTVYTVGELRGTRAVQLAVPPMGGQLQIVKLAETGDAVKSGDVVMEFDASEQEFNPRAGAVRPRARRAGHRQGRLGGGGADRR